MKALAAVVATCGDDGVTSQTNCVAGMMALAEAEATCESVMMMLRYLGQTVWWWCTWWR
jgi:hypothetical protein